MTFIPRMFLVCAAFLAAVACGFAWRDIADGQPPKFSRLPSALMGKTSEPTQLVPTRLFGEALNNIQSAFYGKADESKLTYAAVNGMMSSLKDPHTILLEPDIAKAFEEKNHGEFVGIGAELSPDVMGAKVRRVFKNSPAEAQGMKANDVITKVGARDVVGRDLQDVVREIRGQEGTGVNLTVYRASVREALKFRVVRRRVEIQDVYGEIIPGTPAVGRLEVRSFSETIVAQFDQELKDLENRGIKGLIIDLRGNPGGLLTAAVDMSGRFLENKLITKMKRRGQREESFTSRTGYGQRRYPVVILVDDNSASASEIFAGAMRDWHRATIVGEHTYGKGSVQVVRPLPDGAQIKVTIARYYLPSGESVQRVENEDGQYVSGGIKPDIIVERTRNAVSGDLKTDNQLLKAVQVLRDKLK